MREVLCLMNNTRLDAAMIFPVNKIPISTVIEGRGAQEMVALVQRLRIGPIRALHPHDRRKQEVDMLISTKSGAPEKDRNASVSAAEITGRVVPHDQAWARSEPTTKAGTASCIGSDMSIVGKIECNGPAQVLGRIEGELRASDLQISDGAQVEGSVISQNVTICGRVKGTIRAVRVKLQNGGAVEGDIFHRTLSIDENSQFEGSSRRVENPTEPSSSIDAKDPQKRPGPGPDYSMTSSVLFTSRRRHTISSNRAVWALMTSSNLVDCTTGRSAG